MMMPTRGRRSQVFVVRTWAEERGELSVEMRGMVRNVHSGETRYFCTWRELLIFVASQVKEVECAKEAGSLNELG